MSDPQGKGALDKSGIFLALKLITLAQTGKDVSLANAVADIVELPEMAGEKPVINTDILIDTPSPKQFDLSQEELNMYRKLFQGVVEGGQTHVPGAKVTNIFILIYGIFVSKCPSIKLFRFQFEIRRKV